MGAYTLLIAAPLFYLALSQSPGSNLNVFMLLYGTGWVLFFLYYVSVYTAVQDVVEPRLRASAMFAVPVMLLLTGISLLFASRTYLIDVEKVKTSASA